MAEVIAPTPRQREIAEMRAAGMRDDEIVAQLTPRHGETIIIQQAPAKRSMVPWLVGGGLIALSMFLSFFWNIVSRMMATMERMAENNAQAAAAVTSAPADAPIFVMIGIAVVLIILAVTR